jgi:hypothetical protein
MAPVVVNKKKPPLVVEVKKAASKPAEPKQVPLSKAPSPSKDQGPKEPRSVSMPEKKPEKPKGPEPIDKLQQHQSYLAEIEAIASPLNKIARACYFLTFLFNETRSTTTLFPMTLPVPCDPGALSVPVLHAGPIGWMGPKGKSMGTETEDAHHQRVRAAQRKEDQDVQEYVGME